MKKKYLVLVIVLLLLLLVSCYNKDVVEYTFHVSTGDSVEVSMDGSGSYNLIEKNGEFSVEKDHTTLVYGAFLEASKLDSIIASIKTDTNATILEESSNYIYYTTPSENSNTDLYYYVLRLKGSHTGVVLFSITNEKETKEIIEKLTFRVVK